MPKLMHGGGKKRADKQPLRVRRPEDKCGKRKPRPENAPIHAPPR